MLTDKKMIKFITYRIKDQLGYVEASIATSNVTERPLAAIARIFPRISGKVTCYVASEPLKGEELYYQE